MEFYEVITDGSHLFSSVNQTKAMAKYTDLDKDASPRYPSITQVYILPL